MEKKLIQDIIFTAKKVFKKKYYKLHEPHLIGNEKKYLLDCIIKNNVSSVGYYNKYLKTKLKKLTKSRHIILTSSGTAAIHLSLIALKVSHNHEVLMPTLNYVAAANTTLYCNATPHYIDVERTTLGIDPEKLELYLQKIVKRKNNLSFNKKTNKQIKALIALHAFGHPCRIDKIKKICKSYNIELIEDAAEALGSFYKKKHVGTFGKVGILSFNGNKIVTSGGGGAVITNDFLIAKKIEHISKISKIKHNYKYDYKGLGYNYAMPNINAALGYAQLENLKRFISIKRSLYTKLKKTFLKNKNCSIFQEPNYCRSNYWLQTLIVNNESLNLRNKLIETLIKDGLNSRPIWTLLHKIEHLKKFPHDGLNTSIELEKKIINIPSGTNI